MECDLFASNCVVPFIFVQRTTDRIEAPHASRGSQVSFGRDSAVLVRRCYGEALSSDFPVDSLPRACPLGFKLSAR